MKETIGAILEIVWLLALLAFAAVWIRVGYRTAKKPLSPQTAPREIETDEQKRARYVPEQWRNYE